MEFPPQELVESVVSELSAQTEDSHKDREEAEACTFCKFQTYLDGIAKKTGKISHVDLIAADLMSHSPVGMMLTMTGGFHEYINIFRFSFLVGLMVGRREHNAVSLEELYKKS